MSGMWCATRWEVCERFSSAIAGCMVLSLYMRSLSFMSSVREVCFVVRGIPLGYLSGNVSLVLDNVIWLACFLIVFGGLCTNVYVVIRGYAVIHTDQLFVRVLTAEVHHFFMCWQNYPWSMICISIKFGSTQYKLIIIIRKILPLILIIAQHLTPGIVFLNLSFTFCICYDSVWITWYVCCLFKLSTYCLFKTVCRNHRLVINDLFIPSLTWQKALIDVRYLFRTGELVQAQLWTHPISWWNSQARCKATKGRNSKSFYFFRSGRV